MDLESADDLMAKFGEAVSTEAPPDADPVVVAEIPATEEPAAVAEDTPATEVEGQIAEPAEPADPAEPAATSEPAAPVDPDEASGRYRLKGKLAAVAQLAKEGMAEEEAIERIFGKSPAATAAEPEPAPAPAPDPVATLETELAEVRTKLKAAAADGALYNDELDTLNERRSELLLEIRDAKAAKQQAEQQAQVSEDEQFNAKWQAETDQLIGMFGDAAKDGGVLSEAFLAEGDLAAKDPKHRFHHHFSSGTFTPLTIIPFLAAEKKIALASATPATQAPAAPASPRVLPVSGGNRTAPPPVNNAAVAQARTREALATASSADDMESIFAAANGGMTRGTGFRLA